MRDKRASPLEASSLDILMANVVNFFLNSLSTVWFVLISDPLRSITAFAAIISAFASVGGLIINLKNYTKDATKLDLIVKRAQDGPLILQHPRAEYLKFEVYNQGTTSVVINEIGITVSRGIWKKKQFVNLVGLPHADLDIRNQHNALGAIKYEGLPGSIPPKSLGLFLLHYSGMKTAYLNYQKQEISADDLHFVGSQRLKKTCEEFQKLEDRQGKNVQIIPYVLTSSRERFVGRKAYVKLGTLGDAFV